MFGSGLAVAAMAYRVKYRLTNSDGTVQKVILRVTSLGVHKKNRGGTYPAGVRVRSLCENVIPQGFQKECVNHACIVVEIIPVAELAKRAQLALEAQGSISIDKLLDENHPPSRPPR